MRLKLLAALFATAVPAIASATWQMVASEPGKRVEIDRASIVAEAGGMTTVKGRIVLDKPIVDPKTSFSYRIIEVLNRYNCTERTQATLKRSYFKDEGELLRQEEVKTSFAMPVRSGTPDDKLLREVCRPKPGSASAAAAINTADKVGEVAGELRKANDALIEKEVKKDLRRLTSPAGSSHSNKGGNVSKPASTMPSSIAWSYEGRGGAEHWGRLKPEFAICATGQRQSPIDLRDGIAVDLEPIQFAYSPASFRVVDSGRNLQVAIYGGGFNLLGKNFDLIRIHFHRPAEVTLDGKTFDMDAQLVHKSEDGKLAIVTVLLEQGTENPLVQMVLNNLPLEKGGEVAPPTQSLDASRLLPVNRRYFTFMGSLTTPPCTEDVLWLVLRQPQQISPEQLMIFQRLYTPNARPVQPGFGRIIKESR
ncbi:MAG: carbonic anhydrase family protein [Propionivibrio sp.]|uniref:carbonic anhydrase n=1 Tax=Propionivibrio sp. TaxID=2212460 RepID=UPI001A5D13E0|nr:carbonic anhydrase family protein [Propionivibrio sp.]MBL8416119.1 carbonic anhydrase family protein [Propionivibrio sp.]